MCCLFSQLLCCRVCQGQQRYICEHTEFDPVQREYTPVFAMNSEAVNYEAQMWKIIFMKTEFMIFEST